LVVPKEVKQKEREIIEDLKRQEIEVHFSIDNVNPKTNAWEHTVGFYEILSKEKSDRLFEIIRKHYNEWHLDQSLKDIDLTT
jgi:hypothetical protein